MSFLLVEFAAEKANLERIEEKIMTAIQSRGITFDVSSAQIEQIGVLQNTIPIGNRVVRIPLLRHRWRLKLLAPVEESVLNALRKDLSDVEVQAIRLEED